VAGGGGAATSCREGRSQDLIIGGQAVIEGTNSLAADCRRDKFHY